MKTKEELSAIKTEVENLKIKLAELTDDELKQVTGGMLPIILAKGKSLACFNPHDEQVLGFDPHDEQILRFVPGIVEIS